MIPTRPRRLLVSLLVAAAVALPAATGRAEAAEAGFVAGSCSPDESQASGAIYRICMPPQERFNGDLIVWAHGYVAFNEPLEIPEDNLCGSLGNGRVCINDLANILGFGFITTSYATNGLAVLPGVEDVVDLVDIFTRKHGAPRRVYLVGASEGGLVTALGIERHPGIFDGGLAMCGPVGDFNLTTRYFGDFRVVFDYFFPDLMPGSATEIPEWLIEGWDEHWESVVRPAMLDRENRRKILQLLRVTGAPYLPWDFRTVLRTIHDGLWYSVFATGDAVAKLGGQPYDNVGVGYAGSADDEDLNLRVQRVAADQVALETVDASYQTSGVLRRPLVTVHTDRDQQIPYQHEELYRRKVLASGSEDYHRNFRLRRYGHCSFNVVEALTAFAILYFDVNHRPIEGIDEVFRELEPDGTLSVGAPEPDLSPGRRSAVPRARRIRR